MSSSLLMMNSQKKGPKFPQGHPLPHPAGAGAEAIIANTALCVADAL